MHVCVCTHVPACISMKMHANSLHYSFLGAYTYYMYRYKMYTDAEDLALNMMMLKLCS